MQFNRETDFCHYIWTHSKVEKECEEERKKTDEGREREREGETF
jgi:hypothetical protein